MEGFGSEPASRDSRAVRWVSVCTSVATGYIWARHGVFAAFVFDSGLLLVAAGLCGVLGMVCRSLEKRLVRMTLEPWQRDMVDAHLEYLGREAKR